MTGVADERVWLSQNIDGTDRYFHCPADAAEAWAEMGWQPSDAPPEPVDPAIAHLVEARRRAAEEAAAAQAAKPKTTTKPKPGTPAGGETEE